MEVMTAIPEAPVKMAADPLPRTATAPAPIRGAARPADKAKTKRTIDAKKPMIVNCVIHTTLILSRNSSKIKKLSVVFLYELNNGHICNFGTK